MATTNAAPLVWINGFSGSGKLTVAMAISTLHKEVIVLDNHKLIDPVEAQFPRTHPYYQHERQSYRQAVLEKYVCDTATNSRLVVFTDFQSNNDLGRNVASEYRDAAYRAGRPFVPVYLTCDADTNLERITSLDRLRSGTTKLTDAQALRDLHSRCEVFRFDCCPGLTIDSTNLPPLEVATKILAFVQNSDIAST